jgi:hypothetical protein
MKFNIILLLFIFSFSSLSAQTEKTYHLSDVLATENGAKNMLVRQSPSINNMLRAEMNYNAGHKRIPGWRIQIYFSTGKGAKEGAEATRNKFMEEYPGVKAYVTYFAPYFKVYIGNFRTKREAANFRIQILKEFKEAWLVKDLIEWPDL